MSLCLKLDVHTYNNDVFETFNWESFVKKQKNFLHHFQQYIFEFDVVSSYISKRLVLIGKWNLKHKTRTKLYLVMISQTSIIIQTEYRPTTTIITIAGRENLSMCDSNNAYFFKKK